jgi:site-specific recombinase XerD
MLDNKEVIRSFEQISGELMEELHQRFYSIETMQNYRRTLSRIGTFMERECIDCYSEEVGKTFISDCISRTPMSESHIGFMHTVVRRLNDMNMGVGFRFLCPNIMQPVPMQYAEALEGYLKYCLNTGNKDITVRQKRRVCELFIDNLVSLGCLCIYEINTEYICRAISQFTNKDAYAIIRAFLQHQHEKGNLKYNYSGIIPKYSRGKVLPTTYSENEVHCLEASVDRTSKTGMRNYAVLLLATRLGLRSGDIVKLKYENVDFDSNRITITQEKNKQPLTLPLLPEIRVAVEEYIKYARPDNDNEFIFLSTKAPYVKMTTSSMRHVFTDCFLAAGINISGKKHGPHSLRSSVASSMINEGVPYEVVRKMLGHVDPDAVKHYAKIDIENLRSYAIDVPLPSGNFSSLLMGRV